MKYEKMWGNGMPWSTAEEFFNDYKAFRKAGITELEADVIILARLNKGCVWETNPKKGHHSVGISIPDGISMKAVRDAVRQAHEIILDSNKSA